MILQALNNYYDVLANDPNSDIAPQGYNKVGVSFALNLSASGELLDIFPLFDLVPRGKKIVEVPRRMTVPERVKKTVNIAANFLCDNCVCVLGITNKEVKDPDYAKKRFLNFREHNLNLLQKIDCHAAKAVCEFLNSYDYISGRDNPVISTHLEGLYKGGNLVFKLDGEERFVHDNPDIRTIWEEYKLTSSSENFGQCLVTGKVGPIARLHPSLKGIKGGNPTGTTLVGFNARAYESFNRIEGQGLNSPVCEKATFAYSTALNFLLSPDSPNKKFRIGDTTVVFWAESPDTQYADLFAGLFLPEWYLEDKSTQNDEQQVKDNRAEQRLRDVAQKVLRGEPIDTHSLFEGLDPNTRFYVLGLAPNAARLSVRFFHRDLFYVTIGKVMNHYHDLQIDKEYVSQPTWISINQIITETVSKKAREKEPSPLMAGALFRSILDNTPYPAAVYNAILNRIHTDMDDHSKNIQKINYVRAAMIKAYFIRKYRHQPQHPIKEVTTMSLNKNSNIPAYVLGRLFSVLERAQKEAIPNLDATIKDRYFTSACASPATVFPVLLRLSQHHISKAETGKYRDRDIEEIMGLLDIDNNPIPSHLSLDEQGIFVLGYYHQRAAFFPPKKNNNTTDQTQHEN